jgi:hypothetical protein
MEDECFSTPRDGEGTPAEFNSAGDDKKTPSETEMVPVPGVPGYMGFLRCPVCHLTEADDIVEGHCGNARTVYTLVDTRGNMYFKGDAPYCDHCVGKLRASYLEELPTVDDLDDEYQSDLEESWHMAEVLDARCRLENARVARKNLLADAKTVEEFDNAIASTKEEIVDAFNELLYLGVSVDSLPNESGVAE